MQRNDIYEYTLKDKLTLGPLEKFQQKNRFPWKLILTLVIIIGTSYEVILLKSEVYNGGRMLLVALNREIHDYQNFDQVYSATDSPEQDFKYIWTVTDLQDNMSRCLNAILNLNELIFAEVNQDEINQADHSLEVYFDEKNKPNDFWADVYKFNLIEGLTTPFDISDNGSIKLFLRNVRILKFVFKNIRIMSPNEETEIWHIMMTYSFDQMTNKAVVSGVKERTEPAIGQSQILARNWLVFGTVMVLAFISFLLNVKYVFDLVTLYSTMKYRSLQYIPSQKQQQKSNTQWDEQYLNPQSDWKDQFDIRGNKQIIKIIEQQKPWNSLTMSEKLTFLDAWILLQIASNLLQSFTSLLLLRHSDYVNELTIRSLLGASCFLAWINACRYVEYFDNVYILTYLLEVSLPTIAKFLLGCLPIFIGYTILGQSLFYRISYFMSFQNSFVSLISLSFGNMMYEVPYYAGSTVLASLYTISFCIIFLIVFQNIFTSQFVSMVYNKFEAQTRQELIDYLRLRLPNLGTPILNNQQQDVQLAKSTFISDVQSQSSPNVKPINASPNSFYSPGKHDEQKQRFLALLKIHQKRFEKALSQMFDDVRNDIQLYMIKDKLVRAYINTEKQRQAEKFLFKIYALSMRAHTLARKLKKQ